MKSFDMGGINEKEISSALIRSLRFTGKPLSMRNITINNSPWEADVITVMKSLYWYEYEIKLTKGDFNADFNKSVIGYPSHRNKPNNPRKHDIYLGNKDYMFRGNVIPVPRRFYFVVPECLYNEIIIPEKYGFMIYKNRGITIGRQAENLKAATKLKHKHIFNIATKACWRINI